MTEILRRFDGAQLTLVANPNAGRGWARRLLPRVCSELVQAMGHVSLKVFPTTDFAEARLRVIHAVETARPANNGGIGDAVVVMGGDGMVHLGLNACAETGVPLGVIPAGTGNDFVRGAGLPTRPIRAARAIAAGYSKLIDLSEVTGNLHGEAERRWVGSVVSTGYDARVNRRTNSLRRSFGQLSYAYSALSELASFEPLHYRITTENASRELDAMFIAVGNAGFFGGGMRICPNADIQDGLLDITIVHPVSRATLLRLLPTMFTGGFVKDPAAEFVRAKRVEIDGEGLFAMADGEELGGVPVTVTVRPQTIRLLGASGD